MSCFVCIGLSFGSLRYTLEGPDASNQVVKMCYVLKCVATNVATVFVFQKSCNSNLIPVLTQRHIGTGTAKLSFSGASPKGKFGEATDINFRGRGTKVCGDRRLLSILLLLLFFLLEADYGR